MEATFWRRREVSDSKICHLASLFLVGAEGLEPPTPFLVSPITKLSIELAVWPVVHQHPRVMKDFQPFPCEVTAIGEPPIRAMAFEVAVRQLRGLRGEIPDPNLSWSMNPPRVIPMRSVNQLRFPTRATTNSPRSRLNKGLQISFGTTTDIHVAVVFPILNGAEKPVFID